MLLALLVTALAVAACPGPPARAQGTTVQGLPAAADPLPGSTVYWCGVGTHTYKCSLDQAVSYLTGKQNTWTAGKQFFAPSTTSYASINLAPGTSPVSPANGDLWCTSGSCYVRAAGSTIDIGAGGGSVANPTATIGLTAVNGVSTSAIRSDGAPALSQAIVPTWTGQHTFSVGPLATQYLFTGTTASLPVGSISKTAADGLKLVGAAGSSWAWSLANNSGTAVLSNTVGTVNLTAAGTITAAGVSTSAATITGGSITGITDLAVADGGTGASTASAARTNLGLGTIATQAASAVAITGGSITGITDLAVADGGTGSSTAATARTALGVAMTKIGSGSASAVSSAWVTGLTSAYTKYRLFVTGFKCSSSGANVYLRISNDNQSTTYSGSTYYGAGYDSRSSDGTPSGVNTNAQTSTKMTNDMVGGGSVPATMVLDISTDATNYFMATGTVGYQSSASGYRWEGIMATVDKNSVTDLLFGCSAGNFTFAWTLYGYE